MNLEYTKIKKALQQRRSNDGLFIVTRKRLLSKKKKQPQFLRKRNCMPTEQNVNEHEDG